MFLIILILYLFIYLEAHKIDPFPTSIYAGSLVQLMLTIGFLVPIDTGG